MRTSWHGPNNVSPIGHAINLHVDLAAYNFGIGEGDNFSDQIKELFPGVPEIRNAIRYANDSRAWASTSTKRWRRNIR